MGWPWPPARGPLERRRLRRGAGRSRRRSDAAGRRRPFDPRCLRRPLRPPDRSRANCAATRGRRRRDGRLVAPRGSDADPRFDLVRLPCGAAARHHAPCGSRSRARSSCARSRAAFEQIVRAISRRRTDLALRQVPRLLRRPDRARPNVFRPRAGGAAHERPGLAMVYLGACSGRALGAVGRPRDHARPRRAPSTARRIRAPTPTTAHPCDSVKISSTRSPRAATSTRSLLDVGRDDYYGHSGNWFDLQDSPWLVFLNSQMRLSLQLHRQRRGEERHSRARTAARRARADWNADQASPSTPTPAQGQRFVRWSGALHRVRRLHRRPRHRRRASVALFAPATYALRVAKTGKGTVRGAQGVDRLPVRGSSAVAVLHVRGSD